MNDYRDLMQDEQMPTQSFFEGGIFNIEQFWAFEKFAKDNNFNFETTGNTGECIFIKFYDYPLHVFLLGLDCAFSNLVED